MLFSLLQVGLQTRTTAAGFASQVSFFLTSLASLVAWNRAVLAFTRALAVLCLVRFVSHAQIGLQVRRTFHQGLRLIIIHVCGHVTQDSTTISIPLVFSVAIHHAKAVCIGVAALPLPTGLVFRATMPLNMRSIPQQAALLIVITVRGFVETAIMRKMLSACHVMYRSAPLARTGQRVCRLLARNVYRAVDFLWGHNSLLRVSPSMQTIVTGLAMLVFFSVVTYVCSAMFLSVELENSDELVFPLLTANAPHAQLYQKQRSILHQEFHMMKTTVVGRAMLGTFFQIQSLALLAICPHALWGNIAMAVGSS